VHRLDGGLPHLPARDQHGPEQQLDQLEVERAHSLEGSELLEVVELAVEHVGLRGVRGDVAPERLGELLAGLEPPDQAPRLDQPLFVPAAEELGRHLRLPADARLPDLHRGEDRGAEPAQQPDRQHAGRDRRHLGPVHAETQ
jgi:hypothetical protein